MKLFFIIKKKRKNKKEKRNSLFIEFSGIFGHQNEDMGPKPHDSMHRHLSQSRRGDHRRKGRRRETHHHRIGINFEYYCPLDYEIDI